MAKTVAGFQGTVNRAPAHIHHQDTKTPRESRKQRRDAEPPTRQRKGAKRQRRKGVVAELEWRLRLLTAERQAIRNRLSPVRSPSFPNTSVRRCRSSHRPTCQRFPAVRRPGPRQAKKVSVFPSAPLRLCVENGVVPASPPSGYAGTSGWALRLCAFALEKTDGRRELVDEKRTRSRSEWISALICVIWGFSG